MARDMSRFVTGEGLGGLELAVGLAGHKIIDYDRRAMRKALVRGAADVRKEARRMLARKAVSQPGEVPGMQSGELRRSIGVVSRGSRGGWVKVAPRTIKGSDFYPAFLFYGSPSTGLDPRANFMEMALQNRSEAIRSEIRRALSESLVPR